MAALIAQPSFVIAGQHSHSISSTGDVDASSLLIRREAQQEMLVPASGQVLPLREAADQGAPLQKRKQPTSRSMAPEQAAREAAALPQQKQQQPTGGTPVAAAAAPAASPAAPTEDDPAKHRISKAHLLLLFFLSSLAGLVVVYRQASALFHPRQQELRQEAARSLGRNRGSTTKRWSQVINGAKPEDDGTRVEESRSSTARQEESRSSVPRSAASQDSARGVVGDEDAKSTSGHSVSVNSEVQPPDEAAGGPQISEQPTPPVFQGGGN